MAVSPKQLPENIAVSNWHRTPFLYFANYIYPVRGTKFRMNYFKIPLLFPVQTMAFVQKKTVPRSIYEKHFSMLRSDHFPNFRHTIDP